MTVQAIESLLLYIGLIGLLVSVVAYVTIRLHEGLGMTLVKLARRIGSLVGVIIVLMFTAGLFGYRVTAGEVLASLKTEIRDLYGQAAHLGRSAPEVPDSAVPVGEDPGAGDPGHTTN